MRKVGHLRTVTYLYCQGGTLETFAGSVFQNPVRLYPHRPHISRCQGNAPFGSKNKLRHWHQRHCSHLQYQRTIHDPPLSTIRPTNYSRFYPLPFVPESPLSFHPQLRLVNGTFLDGCMRRLGQRISSETHAHGARPRPTSTPSETSPYEVAPHRERSIESPHHGC
jgi:hypothetical protein